MPNTELKKLTALADLQAQLQDFLLDKSQLTQTITLETDKFKSDVRLDIYYQAYRLRLIEALGKDFPALEKFLGAEKFSELCLDYIAKYPSQDPSLRWFSSHFIAFLIQRNESQAVIDLAQFEWAQIMAFDAPESDLIDESTLTALTPDEWMYIQLQFHPSVHIINITTKATNLWQELIHQQTVSDSQTFTDFSPTLWVIWRKNLQILFQSCNPLEAQALLSFYKGNDLQTVFGELTETVNEQDFQQLPSQIAGFLRRWIQQGWILSLKPSNQTQ